MEKEYPQGFSPFAWGIAIFCLPILLWPLALVFSTVLLEHPLLTGNSGFIMACVFWLYPFILGLIARIAFKWHKTHRALATNCLIGCGAVFYAIIGYIIAVAF